MTVYTPRPGTVTLTRMLASPLFGSPPHGTSTLPLRALTQGYLRPYQKHHRPDPLKSQVAKH